MVELLISLTKIDFRWKTYLMGFKENDEKMYRNNMIRRKVHLCNSFEKKYENRQGRFIVHQYWKYVIRHNSTDDEDEEEYERHCRL